MSDERKKQISITIDIDVLEKIDIIAERENRSRSAIISMLLSEIVDKHIPHVIREAIIPDMSFEEFLKQHPDTKVMFEAAPPEQQDVARKRWEKMRRETHGEKVRENE